MKTRSLFATLFCIAVAGCATTGENSRNFVLPAAEILVMDAGLQLAGRQTMEPEDFHVTSASVRRNLRSSWVVDDDPFEINQFLHPYQGAMYHNIARSSGLGYWTAAAYTAVSATLWEIAGETTHPSRNDLIASGIAGSFLGEPMFRTARLLLDRNNGHPGAWKILGSAIASPPAGLNRAVFRDRFDPARPQNLPAADVRLQVGVATPIDDDVRSRKLNPRDQFVGFFVDYGFPGKTDYSHVHPFDYFRLEGVTSLDGLESLNTRGLLAGKDYKTGGGSLGVWGIYGSYDYFAPEVFRVSTTSLSLGTTLQQRLSDSVTLQTTGLVGTGYSAVQSVGSSDDRDYHYGVAPQMLASARLIAGRRAAFDVTSRGYFVSDVGGFGTGQHDVIFHTDASLALRIAGHHGAAIKYVFSHRAASVPGTPSLTQTRATVGVFYTFLGTSGFGAVR